MDNIVTINNIDYTIDIKPAEHYDIILDSHNPEGQKGDTGNGISSIEKTSTSGLVDTYTIYYTDGNSTTFDVTNGSSIDTIEKTSTSGLVDTYTITLTNGDTETFTVTNGSSIASISKTGTSGLVDTYTITLTNGNTDTFTVTNGKDGIDGTDGTDGEDGFSPIATVTKSGDTATISITDVNGTTTATISDGQDGTDGQSAEITGATATVDDNVGTPSVTVTEGGTSLARSFNFAFSNLKGQQGQQGIQGPTGPSGVEVSTTEPTDPAVEVWLNPNGTADRYLVEASDETILPSWYRIYSDGWCEQGGFAHFTSGGTYTTELEASLIKEFANENYSIQVQCSRPKVLNYTAWQEANCYVKSTSAFYIRLYEGIWDVDAWFYWECKGFVDLEDNE